MIPIWDSSALFEEDRVHISAEFEGEAKAGLVCVVATTKSGRALLSAIVKGSSQSGAFVITKSEITNPAEYANGSDLEVRQIEKRKIPVYVSNKACLVSIDCDVPRSFISLLFTALKPVEVIVLHSIHASLFRGDVSVPSLFLLSPGDSKGPRFPVPNVVTGLAAGFVTYSEFYRVKCRSLVVIEEDFGATKDSLLLWARAIADLVSFDIDSVSRAALDIVTVGGESLGLIYS